MRVLTSCSTVMWCRWRRSSLYVRLRSAAYVSSCAERSCSSSSSSASRHRVIRRRPDPAAQRPTASAGLGRGSSASYTQATSGSGRGGTRTPAPARRACSGSSSGASRRSAATSACSRRRPWSACAASPADVTSASGHIQYHSSTHVSTSRISTTNARAELPGSARRATATRSPAIATAAPAPSRR